MVSIALDAMGGDHAPHEIVKGAVEATKELDVSISLVGQQKKLADELKKYKGKNIEIVPASEVIEMDEAPAQAVRSKKDSSINVAIKLVKEGHAGGVISAGNTGALMTAAIFSLGRISGIERPAIATIFPTTTGKNTLLLDMGANVDCKSKHLVQFAQMGSLYAEHVMHASNPKVGLLSIGEEAEKGNELTTITYPLLKNAGINFIGNIESKDILRGKADVVVCDGFVGNVILKFGESAVQSIFKLLKEEIFKSPLAMLGALLLKPTFNRLRKKIDYDELGGALLLGINGVCIKAHGRAKARAIKNAIRVGAEAVKENIAHTISEARLNV